MEQHRLAAVGTWGCGNDTSDRKAEWKRLLLSGVPSANVLMILAEKGKAFPI